MQRLPDHTWLSIETVYRLLRSLSSDSIHKTVPRGHKAFCYCVVDNQSNIDRRGRGQRCASLRTTAARGTQMAGTCVCFLTSKQRMAVCGKCSCTTDHTASSKNQKCNGCRTHEPFDPQPDPSAVLRITRYYGICNADPAFKKHVTWLKDSSGPSSVAVVEYHGARQPAAVHGNAKKTTTPYTRTPASTTDKVKQAVVHAPPKAVYSRTSVSCQWTVTTHQEILAGMNDCDET